MAADVLIGLLFLIVGLGLNDATVNKIIVDRRDLIDFSPKAPLPQEHRKAPRSGAKAIATRDKILAATIEILKSEGPGAVSGRAVAEGANLTQAAPFYHFSSVADLLATAQHRLFERSKGRYRQGLSHVGGVDVDIDHLIDRTAAVFLREATEYAGESVANYSIWLRADSQPAVRQMIWEAASDQHQSWRHVLRRWKPELDPIDPLLGQALFIGKLVRILATGSRIEDLVGVRREFAFGLNEILKGTTFAPDETVQPIK